MLPLACLALGVLLGLIGGLHFARSMLDGLTRQLDQITKRKP
jgi:hypothetical protein